MKKLTCLGLALVMALSLTACGGNNNSSSNSNGTGNSNTGSAAGAQSTDNNTQTDLSGSVTTNGSTSMEKVVLTLNEQFMIDHPDVKASYDPTGSSTGIEAAKNGSADIGLASRALKDEEVADGLKSTTLALDGIAIIVNADSAISDLTVEQIAQIFKGEVTNWSEMSGADGAIACIGREGGSGTRDGFESITGTEDLCVLCLLYTSSLGSAGQSKGADEQLRRLGHGHRLDPLQQLGGGGKSLPGQILPGQTAPVVHGVHQGPVHVENGKGFIHGRPPCPLPAPAIGTWPRLGPPRRK